jgi:methylmalonyl-CoA mutase N-terminal domain/subunit
MPCTPTRLAISVNRESTHFSAAFTRTCPAAASGRCGSTPASARRAETNQRYRYLLEHGQTGLSVAFDLPTQMGYDPDHEMARGEVGRVGVAISSR